MNQRLLSAALLGLVVATSLGGCSTLFGNDDSASDTKTDKPDKKELGATAMQKKNEPICPQVAIVRELDTLRDYGGEQPDPAQLVSAAHMLALKGSCEYLTDKDNPVGIDVNYTLTLEVGRGPRLGLDRVSLPYFIAVVDPAETIIAKDRLSAELQLPHDRKAVLDSEQLHVFIPLPLDRQDSGPAFRVLTGFQLTPEQAAAAMK